jgi:hypothetical protein
VLRANIGNYMYNGLATAATQANVFNPLGYLANTLNDVLTTGLSTAIPSRTTMYKTPLS